jgi:hypothetical protein
MRDREHDAARYLQAHKEDAEEWEEEGEKPSEGRPTSIVFSIRFKPEEMAQIKYLADIEAIRISDLLRQAVHQYISSARRPRITVGAPIGSRFVITNVELAGPPTEARRPEREPPQPVFTTGW